MDKREQIWQSLRDSEYRKEFSADVGTGLAFQIRMLREKHGWTQEQLADRTGKRQETISQWENPDYGSYTLNTLRSLAGAFDVALIVKFAPFSELVDWTSNLSPQRLAPPSFEEDQLPRVDRGFVWTTTGLPGGDEILLTLTGESHYEWQATAVDLSVEPVTNTQQERRPEVAYAA